MKISDATALIRNPTLQESRPQSWCDLGCGSGTFTLALAQSLAPGSAVHAVDLDQQALEGIPDQYHGVAIRKVLGDLRSPSLRLPSVDEILMANSLHFIRDQQMLLRKLAPRTGCFLIVEYERSKPSHWVPFPLAFMNLCELFRAAGVERIEKLATLQSRFGGTMYSAFAARP